jgi:hypothetical protein
MIRWWHRRGTMRPNKPETTGEGDLFRARLEQITDLKHELVQLAGEIDWDWIDCELAPLYSDKGRAGSRPASSLGCCSSPSIDCPTRAGASAGSTTRTSSTSLARSFSSTSSRTNAQT